jgi:hypothetical protein
MDSELIHQRDSEPPAEKPQEVFSTESDEQDQELGSIAVTWTLSCLDGNIDPKAYERLRSEINWAKVADDGTMTFSSSDRDEIFTFSNKIRTIFEENEKGNIVEALSFTIRPAKRAKAEMQFKIER